MSLTEPLATLASDSKVELWVDKDIRRRRLNMSMVVKQGGVLYGARPVVFERMEEEQASEVCLPISFEVAVALMTELWNAGIRPTGVGTSGELAAMKAHLEDMRTLVFSKKEVHNG